MLLMLTVPSACWVLEFELAAKKKHGGKEKKVFDESNQTLFHTCGVDE